MATIIQMRPPQDETLLDYRNLDGLFEEIDLAAGVCKTLIEHEMRSAKDIGERLFSGKGWLLVDKKTSDRMSFLLCDLERRIDLLKESFYDIEAEEFFFFREK